MLVKPWASPLGTLESYCSSFSPSDLSTSMANFAVVMWNPSCRVKSHIQAYKSGERSYTSGNRSNKWKLHGAEKGQLAVLLEGEEKETWEECKQILSSFNFTLEESGLLLGKAFGWSHSPYWGEERKKEVPRNESINEVLDYLKDVGLSDDDLHKLLRKFPEVLGCSLNDEVKANVAALEKEWGIEGKTLRNLLLRNPRVLGYNVDCKGDCMAKCTRCWVRF